MEKNFFKKGAHVIYHYKEWRQVYYLTHGTHDWVHTWKRATVLETPRDEYGRFTNDFRYERDVFVKLRDNDGKVFTATLYELEPDVDPGSLTDDELKTLWSEISHGSMYYSDYRNSLGVFENTALNYYEGYFEELCDELGSPFNAEQEQCAETFAEYYQGCEYLRA